MSRSRLVKPAQDLQADAGAVLWSFIKGEQLEFPITLSFIEDATVQPSNNYAYEAVIVEAQNTVGQTTKPTTIQPAGVQTTLTVRRTTLIGTWSAVVAYNKEEIVLYNGIYYKLLKGAGRVDATVPSADPLWEVTTLNKVYLQFPSNIASTWTVQPAVNVPVYGFFELRITEPTDPIFQRTWKPVRGMVEILFSPTDVVVDV